MTCIRLRQKKLAIAFHRPTIFLSSAVMQNMHAQTIMPRSRAVSITSAPRSLRARLAR
jgi:hypothetical protein